MIWNTIRNKLYFIITLPFFIIVQMLNIPLMEINTRKRKREKIYMRELGKSEIRYFNFDIIKICYTDFFQISEYLPPFLLSKFFPSLFPFLMNRDYESWLAIVVISSYLINNKISKISQSQNSFQNRALSRCLVRPFPRPTLNVINKNLH